MKTFLKILGFLMIFIALVLAGVMYLTAGMVEVGDEFFDAARKGDIDQAHSQLAREFQASATKGELLAFLDTLHLQDVEEVQWGERSFSSGRGNLAGTLKLKGGGRVPLNIDLIEEEDGWKIYAIHKSLVGIQETPAAKVVPADEEVVRLVNESTLVFAESVYEKNMGRFRNHISVLWQDQTDVATLDGIFAGFFGLESDLRVLRGFAPVFTAPPAIDDRGVLVVAGHYPTQPDKFHFEQRYIYEGVGWKLVGFSANIGP
ncbi:MAG: hypothetical protein HKN19_01000 [Halioglobus sp.]|nr:hypothetical protein [Halioglobus sp.]